MPTEILDRFLKSLGARKRQEKYILDEWSSDYFIIFDTADDADDPETQGTARDYPDARRTTLVRCNE